MEQLMLFSLEPKIKRAIENFKIYEETALRLNPKGYYLSFSGGKDSQVIYHLARMANVKFEPHYHITTVDPPELVQFVKKTYPEVIRDRPELSMWDLIVKKQFPPTRKIRYCCSVFKEHGGDGQFAATGVRWAESRSRRTWNLAQVKKGKETIVLNNDNHEKRRLLENCAAKGKYILNPVIDWTLEEVWCFIHQYVQDYCSLYDCGFHRLGCIGCPMASVRQRKWELERYPKYKQAYLRAFDRMLKGHTWADTEGHDVWRTAEDVYYWWLYGNEKKETGVAGQCRMPLAAGGGNMTEEPETAAGMLHMEHKGEQKEIQGKAFEEWAHEFQLLSDRWAAIYAHGDIGKMWPDGGTLNELRQEMAQIKEAISESGEPFSGAVPREMPKEYVADSDGIRVRSRHAIDTYLASQDYQYLARQAGKPGQKQKNKVPLMEALGRVQRLIDALERDDLVVLREYGTPGLYDRLIKETAQKVKAMDAAQPGNKEKASKKHGGGTEADAQISIFDLAS